MNMSSNPRSRARARAVQALYQWQLTGQNVSDIESQFLAEEDMKGVDVAYFSTLLHEVPANLKTFDEHLAGVIDRGIEAVDPVERAVLRLGVCELALHPEVPYRVAINEAVELAKVYGAEQGHKYVNGVLDKLARKLRKPETGARK
ncbi:MAG: transcription antitermination factor NusB [Thiohalomonadaceae bacterium]